MNIIELQNLYECRKVQIGHVKFIEFYNQLMELRVDFVLNFSECFTPWVTCKSCWSFISGLVYQEQTSRAWGNHYTLQNTSRCHYSCISLICTIVTTQIAKTLGLTLIRYRSDTLVSDRYRIKVNLSVFGIFELSSCIPLHLLQCYNLKDKVFDACLYYHPLQNTLSTAKSFIIACTINKRA